MLTSARMAMLVLVLFSANAYAADMAHEEHGGGMFHKFLLETGLGNSSDGDALQTWHLDGWIGSDEDKIWLKSEGEREEQSLQSAEYWAMYSKNVDTFWDAQLGIRYDTHPDGLAYLTVGVNGLAPQFFETEAHMFVSEKGDVSARLRQENDLLLTQQWILQPYVEINASAHDVPELEVGEGITDAVIGLQARYEFTRAFAPYIETYYEQKIGQTASIAKRHGEDKEAWVGAVGIRWMF